MSGSIPQFHPTILAHLVTDEATARAIADAIAEIFEPEEVAVAAFEIASLTAGMQGRSTAPAKAANSQASVSGPASANVSPARAGREGAMGTLLPDETGPWRLELHFADAPEEASIRDLVAGIAGEEAAIALAFETIAATDWVANALDGLKPVAVGPFVVHGAHDRGAVAINQIGIEIEAALAFGTGHHGTTRGCLAHLGDVLHRRRPRRIVDIGTGTGVLAIAAARALRVRVLAGEIDPDSVVIAAANARLNGVGHLVRPVRAAGLRHPALAATRSYDLVFANILARPLRRIAAEVARATARNGELILSGLLPGDLAGVLSAYRAQGFHLAAKREIEGWLSLRLRRGGMHARRGKR